ncbi:hypothetical protein [Archaeoglobus neptunius]|uniref:hypothetical protein n=1 Tax=Archaeoglobus neptunius TaxID=2798580 RepID=UPI0019270BE4|nr:hypothetical protein [Archaeoglobus neptunius]
MKASEVEDFRDVIPSIRTKAKSETEKAITPVEIVKVFLNDNAFSVEGVPADVYRIIEFMQGTTGPMFKL